MEGIVKDLLLLLLFRDFFILLIEHKFQTCPKRNSPISS
jgi:hypothetical protein